MRFAVLGDLHGNPPKVIVRNADAIIAPGDFCNAGEIRGYAFRAISERAGGKRNVQWHDLAGKRKAEKLVLDSVRSGRDVLEKLNSLDKPVYIVPGNSDTAGGKKAGPVLARSYFEEMIKGLRNIRNCYCRLVDIGDYIVIGYGITDWPEKPPASFRKTVNRETLKVMGYFYKTVRREQEGLFRRAGKTGKPVIYISHNMPYKTHLDVVRDKSSPRHGQHVGSVIVREMVEKYQPLVMAGGHMHEHFGMAKIGRTVCINAGVWPKNVLLEVEGNKIKDLDFILGEKPSRQSRRGP
ncbi:MAG: metallophosphoesterase [Candidatus Aenigmarchaeota archaeon]|nr:metallophosphoesterase [Candidatus Aenigmarchaeota archaeon]